MIDHSKIILKQHETGVTFDFPLSEPVSELGRRRAWLTFEVGIVLLVVTVIAYAAYDLLRWFVPEAFLGIPFLVGLIHLVAAAVQSGAAWQNTSSDDDLRQLSIAGNLLIRTSRAQHKQVWYRDEIAAVVVAAHASKDLDLVVESHNGERVILGAHASAIPAELDWVASELWRALQQQAAEAEALAHAFAATNAGTPETRIAEGDSPLAE